MSVVTEPSGDVWLGIGPEVAFGHPTGGGGVGLKIGSGVMGSHMGICTLVRRFGDHIMVFVHWARVRGFEISRPVGEDRIGGFSDVDALNAQTRSVQLLT